MLDFGELVRWPRAAPPQDRCQLLNVHTRPQASQSCAVTTQRGRSKRAPEQFEHPQLKRWTVREREPVLIVLWAPIGRLRNLIVSPRAKHLISEGVQRRKGIIVPLA